MDDITITTFIPLTWPVRVLLQPCHKDYQNTNDKTDHLVINIGIKFLMDSNSQTESDCQMESQQMDNPSASSFLTLAYFLIGKDVKGSKVNALVLQNGHDLV